MSLAQSFARQVTPGAWVEILPPCWLDDVPLQVDRLDESGELSTVTELDRIWVPDHAWLAGLTPAQRAAFDIEEVAETPLPLNPAVRVPGSVIQDLSGVPTRAWITEAIPVAEARAAALVAAELAFNAARQAPLTWDFGSIAALDDDGGSLGPAGAQTLQMRDSEGKDDLKNWLSAQAGAQAMKDLGLPDALLPVKTTANAWVQTTAIQVMQVLLLGDGDQLSALQRGQAILRRFGVIKKAINAAATTSVVLSIDVRAGYPS